MSVPVPDFLSELSGSEERIDCPLCGEQNHVPVYDGVALRGNKLRGVVCTRCTHVFLNPRPTLESLKNWYAGAGYFHLCAIYSDVNLNEKMAQFGDEAFWVDRAMHGRRLYKEYLVGELGEAETVFDFGCGDGAWLLGLREVSGCRVDGEEVSATYLEVVRDKLGFEFFNGAVEELESAIIDKHRNKVKVAIVAGSLQHMADPMVCLRIAREILTEDGYLYICNWNLFDHYMVSYGGTEPRRLLGEILSWEHLHYFHESTYRFLVNAAGFEITAFKPESTIRPRHMEILARPVRNVRNTASPQESYSQVVDRIRAFESATIAERLPGSWLS